MLGQGTKLWRVTRNSKIKNNDKWTKEYIWKLNSFYYCTLIVNVLPWSTQSYSNAIWSGQICMLTWADRRYDYGEGWFDWIYNKFIGNVFSMSEFEWILYNSVIPFSSPEQKNFVYPIWKRCKTFCLWYLLTFFLRNLILTIKKLNLNLEF